jgi:hypothetical protein
MTINPQLNDEVKSIAEQYSAEVLAADYFRYDVKQTKLEITISEPRKPDIFEEFVLQSAIDMSNPLTDVEEIADMLCIDPILISKTTEKLENYGSLAVNSDDKIHVNFSAQELFTNSYLILKPTCTKDAYYINDPFAGSEIKNKPIANAPQSLFSLNDYQDNLLEIKDKYQEIESLTLSQIKNIIDYSDLQIRDNQEVIRFQVVNNRIQGSKKVSIFAIKTNTIQFLIEEQELKSLSDTLTQLSQEGQLDWQDLFSQRQAVALYPSVLIPSDSTEELQLRIEKILESKWLTQVEKEEVKKYVDIFLQQGFTEHWHVNEWISGHNCWNEFKNMRSINDHVKVKGIQGISPKFFAIVCEILKITDSGGSPLLESRHY